MGTCELLELQEAVPDAAAHTLGMDLQIGDLCTPTEKRRDESVEKQIAMEGCRGNRTPWKREEQAAVSVFKIALSRGSWSFSLCDVAPFALSIVPMGSCTGPG